MFLLKIVQCFFAGICSDSHYGSKLLAMKRRWQNVFILLVATSPVAIAVESVQHPATPSPFASRVLLTDSAKTDAGYVALGLYGNVVYSPDGLTWQQGKSPTQVLLTNVFFVNDKIGWAGGHDTLILHTTDGGQSWTIQHEDPIPGGDIPKPIIDILFTDAKTGYAAGAYGLLLATKDGGETWVEIDTLELYDRLEALEMEPEPNFNSLLQLHDKILIVGELGTILLFDPKADNEAARWQLWQSPYAGSFFGATQLSNGDLVLYGLRGNVYRSAEPWQDWQKIETGVIANIYDCIELDGGELVLLGASGTILKVEDGGTRATRLDYPGFDTLVSGQRREDQELLLFGSRGAQLYKIK